MPATSRPSSPCERTTEPIYADADWSSLWNGLLDFPLTPTELVDPAQLPAQSRPANLLVAHHSPTYDPPLYGQTDVVSASLPDDAGQDSSSMPANVTDLDRSANSISALWDPAHLYVPPTHSNAVTTQLIDRVWSNGLVLDPAAINHSLSAIQQLGQPLEDALTQGWPLGLSPLEELPMAQDRDSAYFNDMPCSYPSPIQERSGPSNVKAGMYLASKAVLWQQDPPSSDMTLVSGLSTINRALPKLKRKPLDELGRAKAKTIRRLGACYRCRIYKLSCDEELPCSNCLKVKDSQKVYRGPCVRPNMDEVHTFRASDSDNGAIRSVLAKYAWMPRGEVKRIKLQWPFQTRTPDTPFLFIDCQMYQHKKEILAEEYQSEGVLRVVKLPPWACRNTKTASKDIQQFMMACQTALEAEYRTLLVDPIMTLTWDEIRRYATKYQRPLLIQSLQLHAGAVMNSKYFHCTETNVFGVADETHTTPYFFERLPLPAQLIYQLQTMVGQAMLKIQADLLKGLRAKVYSKDRCRDWYEVYLVIFILLATLEFLNDIQMQFVAIKQGASSRNSTNISYVTQYMEDEWEASAFNLIAHFRCVMNGEIPFTQSWTDDGENVMRTGLDADALCYMRSITRELDARNDELEELRSIAKDRRSRRPLGLVCELFMQTIDRE